MSRTETVVTEDEAGMRLDRWCRQHLPALTQGQLEKFLRKKVIRRNGGRGQSADRLVHGDAIEYPVWCREAPKEEKPTAKAATGLSAGEAQKQLKALQLFATKDLLALNKPAGLAVQGGSGVKESVDALFKAAAGEGEAWKLVHRLDKDTSGLLLAAKTAKAARELTAAFRTRRIAKTYWALVKGVPEMVRGQIDLPLAQGGGKMEKTVVDVENGQRARTRYEILEKLGDEMAWLALYPETGRKHQLRAHLAAIGHPIIGDGKYGGAEAHVSGIAGTLHLHARALDVREVYPSVPLLVAPLTGTMKQTWKALELEERDEQGRIF